MSDIRRDTLPHDIAPHKKDARAMTRQRFVEAHKYPWLIYARSSLWDRTLVLARQQASGGTLMVSFDIAAGGMAFLHPIRKRVTAADDPSVYVGRTAENDLFVPVASVSSRHGRFVQGKHWVFEDLQSSNGTWVDEQRIGAEPAPLHDGSLVRLGGNLLTYFVSSGRMWELLNDDAELDKLIQV